MTSPDHGPVPQVLRALTLSAFFVSGFAALVYQVIWQRLLALFSGADVYSATVIVTAFMAGLGAGNLAGGRVADRVSRRTALWLFAGAEGAIGAFGALSAWLYYDVLYGQLGQLDLGRSTTALVLFTSLLWPTFFMGASLPLLARAITDGVGRAASRIGALYGLNTLGAAAGAVAGTWVLIPSLGLGGSLRAAVVLNLACAAALLPVATWWRAGEGEVEPRVETEARGSPAPAWTWMFVYGCAGFIALSFEILWFRILGVVAKSTAFTFGTLLAVYLIGIGLGAIVGSRLASRMARPERTFWLLQASAGLLGCALIAVLAAVADDVRALVGYLGQYEPLNVRESVHQLRSLTAPANFLRFYVAVPVLLVLPPTILMGCSFPVLQRVVQVDDRLVGRRVSAIVGANIVGSVLGAALTGGVLLTRLGTSGTVTLLGVMSAGFALPLLRRASARGRAMTAAAAVASIVAVPSGPELWARLHGTTPEHVVVAEDNTGLAVIRAERAEGPGAATVFVNGMGQSLLPFGGLHSALGVVPVLLHPAPKDVAIIGLGSGDTVYAAAGLPEIDRITCVEIVGSQLEALRGWSRRDDYAALATLLRDPRVTHVVGDGRAYLLRSSRLYDVIEADALRPTSAFAGNLYSDGYFSLVRSRLKPGGLAVTWAPTPRVRDGFITVFPYVLGLPGFLVGSNEPLDIDRALVARRLADPRVTAHFARARIDLDDLMQRFLPADVPRIGPDVDRSQLTDINTDLFPRDEFDLSPPS